MFVEATPGEHPGPGSRTGKKGRPNDAAARPNAYFATANPFTMQLYCGCSGFYYPEWRGDFYPEDLPRADWLSHFAATFDTVEVNSTFYGIPREKTVRGWYDKTPPEFRFSVKGNRLVTHQEKLVPSPELVQTVERMLAATAPLADKLAVVLWQLPASVRADTQLLADFLDLLPDGYDYTIEFRHASWFDEAVYQLLADHGVALCAVSTPIKNLPETVQPTADFSYVRLHGKEAWYKSDYSDADLEDWARKIHAAGTERAYVYFDNTMHGHAVRNALRFR